MRIFFAAVSTLAIVAFVGSSHALAADALTAEMAPFSYLIGSWNCSTSLPAMNGQPAHTAQATVAFEAVPGNVVHDHVSSPEYAGDDYFGYSAKMKMYWSASADATGGHGAATSPDGKTYTGTSSVGPVTFNIVSTYTKTSPTAIGLHEVISGGGEQQTIDSSCTR